MNPVENRRHSRPDLAAFLDRQQPSPPPPPSGPAEFARARAGLAARLASDDSPARPLALVRDLHCPTADGPLALRLYDRRAERGPAPLVLFCHGGGFVFGGIDTHDSLCSLLADRLDLPLVSVGYRLAPEHPWPAAPDDCEAAARWLAASPRQLGRQVTGLVLAGDSAGGCLAAVTALALRDAPAQAVAQAQLLLYPVVHFDEQESGAASGVTGMSLGWYRDRYRPDRESWRAVPLKARLEGLAPTVVITAALDPLRDHGRLFAQALVGAGVTTVYRQVEEAVHAFANLRGAVPSFAADVDWSLAALERLLAND